MKACAASLFSEALVTTIVSTHRSVPSFGIDVLDRRVLGDAVVAPAVPGLDQQRLARHELRVEGRVVIGEQGLLGLDQQRP